MERRVQFFTVVSKLQDISLELVVGGHLCQHIKRDYLRIKPNQRKAEPTVGEDADFEYIH